MVTIRYWAAARAAAGVAEEDVEAGTLAEVLNTVITQRGQDSPLAAVLAMSSFLVDGRPASRRPAPAVAVGNGSVVEVLPPFAGG